MTLMLYYILFATILLVGMISTVLIGISKKNNEGNPEYDSQTKGNWLRLSWIYIVIIILGYFAFIIYITKSNT
jgi:heme/copper-type cytochrome/quinol oxidase subunit 2